MSENTVNAQSEKCAALARLRELCPAGTTVYSVQRHKSGSGMSRCIDFYVFRVQPDGSIVKWWLSRLMAALGPDTAVGSWDKARECLNIRGCGMDMAAHTVGNLSAHLWGGDERAIRHERI